MRVMVIVKSSEAAESGVMPTQAELAAMGAFNDELAKAGVMLAGEGLRSSSKGVRLQYSGGSQTVIDGPFAETKELVAGFWILQVASLEEAIEWMKRAPFEDNTIEIRPVHEAEDFGDALTPELREAEQRLREQTQQN
jgi:hypothetical protein